MRSRRDATATRDRLRALTRTAYTAAQGHLEVDPAAAEVAPRPRRWRLSPRAARAAVVLLVAVGAVAGVRTMASAGADPVPVGPGWGSAEQVLGEQESSSGQARSESAASAGADAADSDSAPQVPEPADPEHADPDAGRLGEEGTARSVVVHVAGRVVAPGVVDLPAGSRVHHAIAAAGGASSDADLNALNLARPLTDGEQVYVPAPGEAAPMAAGSAPGPAAGASGPVDLNRADSAQLEALPGIGPVLAGRILQWRTDHGRFTSVEELGEVTGIGTTLLARLRDLVTV